MDDKREKTPQYYADIVAALTERTIKRLWVLIVLLTILLAASNIAWVWYLNQYDFETYSVDISTKDGGNANYIGQDGNIYNGLYKNGTPDSD